MWHFGEGLKDAEFVCFYFSFARKSDSQKCARKDSLKDIDVCVCVCVCVCKNNFHLKSC